MSNMKNRNLKVVSESGRDYKPTPAIRLKGQWLQLAGFQIGDYVSVRCEEGRLIIEPDTERAKVMEAEKSFMERELKKLQKKFEAEKERLHVQFVAEQGAGYGV